MNNPQRLTDQKGRQPVVDDGAPSREWACPSGMKRRQQEGYNMSKDFGCSVPDWLVGWFGWIDSDHPQQGVSFFPACKEHDKCYRTCQPAINPAKERIGCDDSFRENMKEICRKTPYLTAAERQQCMGNAEIYYKGVRTYAGGAYFDRQREACGECECPN